MYLVKRMMHDCGVQLGPDIRQTSSHIYDWILERHILTLLGWELGAARTTVRFTCADSDISTQRPLGFFSEVNI